ncbi:MAG: hypothetical protein ACI92O_000483 [Colwellia sp.]
MKILLLRHFHCNLENTVSNIGLQQFEDVVIQLKRHELSAVIATNHPRVINSAKLLCDLLSLNLEVTASKSSDCIENINNREGILILSQQPILVEIAGIKANETYTNSCFPTGKLVEVKIL